jgi:7-cyano-7-deazaguanine synthase in queuosine biosynthesis
MADAITLLWTGGWDSTFRLLEILLIEKKKVTPHYIIDPGRRSTMFELSSMARIRDRVISKFPDLEMHFSPLVISHIHEIPADKEVSGWFAELRSKARIGTQYEWLASYARYKHLHELELCIEKHPEEDFGPLDHLIHSSINGLRHETRIINTNTEPALRLFSNFRFPVIDRTKLMMQAEAESNGFLEFMSLIWFCHRPSAKGKLCGYCRPCRLAKSSGLTYEFAKPQFLYWFKNKFKL